MHKAADFTWLPYPFTSAGPGPETTLASLIQVENNVLGTNDKNDAAHYVDVLAYVREVNNDLRSANAMTTTDAHWCGHFSWPSRPTSTASCNRMRSMAEGS